MQFKVTITLLYRIGFNKRAEFFLIQRKVLCLGFVNHKSSSISVYKILPFFLLMYVFQFSKRVIFIAIVCLNLGVMIL